MQYKYPNLSDEQLKPLLTEIHHWGLTNGLVMYPQTGNPENTTAVAPITVYPTIIPEKCFDQAIGVQTVYNELYAKIVQDYDWLHAETEKLSKHDSEFTGKLWDVYLKAKKLGIPQKLELGIFRNDFLIDSVKNEIKQVEFNTVSVSFGGLSTKVSQLHRYLKLHGFYSDDLLISNVPVSDSAEKLSDGLFAGVHAYEEQQYGSFDATTIVAFIVQDGERNVFDQRILEYNLASNHGIKAVRLTIQDVPKLLKKCEKTSKLFYTPTNDEISVVYFRSGYAPNDFKSEQDWESRLLLETSLSIKAPSLKVQLSGTKKIQQLLTDENILRKFISDDDKISELQSTFVQIYPLDDSPLGVKAKEIIKTGNTDNYVLKPQREGGGNNIYKSDINPFLADKDEKDWSAYILMEMINAEPTEGNVILRNNELYREKILSEFGVFGVILFDENQIHHNEYSGWLLRSKFSSSNEGGVAAGFGCVDSVAVMPKSSVV
ncbi:hypothetical protein ACO0QE_003210 [Hanseniaspora vineae]